MIGTRKLRRGAAAVLPLVMCAVVSAGLGPAVAERGERAACAPSGDPTFSRFYEHLNILLWRFYDTNHVLEPWDLKGHFTSQPGYTYDLPGTTDMVVLLWSIGELETRTTDKGRGAWAGLIRSFQDKKTGLFIRGNRRRMSVADLTGRACAALKLLGKRPRYPFRWAHSRLGDQWAVDAWVAGMDWDDLGEGSLEMGLAAALAMFPDRPASDRWRVWLLDAIDRRRDPATGLWGPSVLFRLLGSATMADVEASARFWWYLEVMAEPMPAPESVVEAILELQGSSGLWGARVLGESPPGRPDLAALNGLRYAYTHLDADRRAHLESRVLGALDRFACAALRYLSDPDVLESTYTDTRELSSAVLAVAEMDALYFEMTGRHKFALRKPWRPALPYLAWM